MDGGHGDVVIDKKLFLQGESIIKLYKLTIVTCYF